MQDLCVRISRNRRAFGFPCRAMLVPYCDFTRQPQCEPVVRIECDVQQRTRRIRQFAIRDAVQNILRLHAERLRSIRCRAFQVARPRR